MTYLTNKEIDEKTDKLYKTLGFKDELSFEELPADIQLKQFIYSIRKEDLEGLKELINNHHNIALVKNPDGQTTEFISKDDITTLLNSLIEGKINKIKND